MSKYLIEDTSYKRSNPETGELEEFTGKKTIQLKVTEPFFLTYSKQILALYDTDVLNATTKVLYKMLEFAEWNTGRVYMPTDRIEELMNACHISRASYQRAVKELIDKGIIIKGKGVYTVAENMFWKGEVKVRDAVIKAKAQLIISPVLPEYEIVYNEKGERVEGAN